MITTENHKPLAEIHRCRPWIEAALEKSVFEGVVCHEFSDVAQMIQAGAADLWATDKGCIVTFCTVYPRAKVMTMWLAGGDFEHVMEHLEEEIVRFAKSQGCVLMHLAGRKGWERKLLSHGFKPHQSIVQRKL